ncbi:alpha/beta hydrolase [Amycolatopsis cihanbeyliensis]|uniref:alpha/beta hydrolase n=1 Tax=Amycolatopsis cihanbeyliensis TaxID=1128664 RepID=UPI001FE547EC|nr:alpha/beta hydrolase [Amycolatopsis cihanbeyliensis]
MNEAYNKIIACGDDLRDINTPDGWSGDAAGAAANAANGIIDGLEEYSAEIAAMRRGMAATGDAITGIQHGVTEAESLAATHHFRIGDEGAIIDEGPPPDIPDGQREAVAAERRTVAAELRERVTQVLKSAGDLDNDFCAVLDRILADNTIDATANDNQQTSLAAAGNAGAVHGGLSIPPPPPAGATAAQNAAYWATLSEGQRTQLAMDLPELVGPRDGFSAKQRDIANRRLMERERTELQNERNRLLDGIDAAERGTIDPTDTPRLKEKLGDLDNKIRGLDNLAGRLEQPPDTPEDQKYYLLDIDGSHDGRAIVAHGNPDTAQNVATFVPGTGTDLANFGSTLDRADVMHRAADKATSESNSVIAWLDYDAPDSIPDAAFSSFAEGARQPLDGFQDGLRESHQGDTPSHNTIIGHSYGSTAAGFAARDQQLAMDDFIAIGSPGVGVDDATGLHLPPDRVWAVAAENDPVADLGHFGTAPDDPSFGANTIFSAPGSSWPIVGYSPEAHSQYWDPRNPSLAGIGQVIAGKQPH